MERAKNNYDYEPDYRLIDQKLLPIAEMIHSLSEIEGVVEDDGWGLKMSIDEIEVDMPMELDVITDEHGKLVLGSGPPTQTIETTFMPVFHRVKIGIKIINAEDNG